MTSPRSFASYRIARVVGDRYAGEFPREQFRKRGIHYAVSEKPKSDLFRDLLPLLNSGRIVLPKSDRLVNQLTGLERRTARSGKDCIDHSPGTHDDIANAVAGAADCIVARAVPRARAARARHVVARAGVPSAIALAPAHRGRNALRKSRCA